MSGGELGTRISQNDHIPKYFGLGVVLLKRRMAILTYIFTVL